MNANQTFSNREAVIQPYVMIILRGHPADERDYTTKVVPKVKATLTLLLLLLLLLLLSKKKKKVHLLSQSSFRLYNWNNGERVNEDTKKLLLSTEKCNFGKSYFCRLGIYIESHWINNWTNKNKLDLFFDLLPVL